MLLEITCLKHFLTFLCIKFILLSSGVYQFHEAEWFYCCIPAHVLVIRLYLFYQRLNIEFASCFGRYCPTFVNNLSFISFLFIHYFSCYAFLFNTLKVKLNTGGHATFILSTLCCYSFAVGSPFLGSFCSSYIFDLN